MPLVTAHSNDRESAAALEKLRRVVVEASKQCGRNRLMTIDPPTAWEEFVGSAGQPEANQSALRIVAHPGHAPLGETLDAVLRGGAVRSVTLAVGPEGGFTDAETARAASTGWQLVDLAPTILRIETAALTLVAAVVSRLDARRAN